MNKLSIIFVLFLATQLSAQTDKEASNRVIEHGAANQAELLAHFSEPADDATSVKVIVQKKQTIEEYRQRGELVLVKVTPNDGAPYFIDPLERENLNGSGRDLINSSVKPVRWVLKEF